ncbi:uncharacterized protein B0J16DRAFT_382787 [Fusarium flagelliforme]|uniref:uncharacterized protein n=1 Tax=Fusarium flagelliforme TaxID=2675880 RepID=UPI001E8CF003|nr:uncharacterized protein B0J16DRAFT_382787 [Fusarium flagelliforme]KAH7188913.1 hypothetical protein B0J16DRAFT_382787 [Fusarium flagelliforme]
MAISQEVIVAIVGIIINLPAFVLVFWRVWIKRRRSKANRNSENHNSSQPLLLQPRRLTNDTMFALAIPYAVPLVDVRSQEEP